MVKREKLCDKEGCTGDCKACPEASANNVGDEMEEVRLPWDEAEAEASEER